MSDLPADEPLPRNGAPAEPASQRGVNPYQSPATPAGKAPPRPAAPTYGAQFWFAYAGNTLLMTAISLLFRYADFVQVLSGGKDAEWHLGWIVGAGMVGSLLMRFAQAEGIDRLGPARIWIWSALGFAIVCVLHTLAATVHSPAVYLLRIALQTCIAGAFGASITYISMRAPVVRVAEVIGTLGTSGFVGMMGGSLLGDWIFGLGPVQRYDVDRMFYWACSLGLASTLFAWLATRGQRRPIRKKQPPVLWLVRRYHPGVLLLVGMAVGIGAGLPTAFLRPYAESLGIPGIWTFFWVYAPMAFITRIATRRMPQRMGLRPMIFAGIGCLVVSMLLYPLVYAPWMLTLPAVFAGVAHGFLFPSVTGGGSTAFPTRYRGLGVTLMLAMFDMGNLFGAPLAGSSLKVAGALGLSEWTTMFLTMAGVLGAIGLVYGLFGRSRTTLDEPVRPRVRRAALARQEEAVCATPEVP